MPRRDGTGPMGRGPMTGRGMGFCIKEVKEGLIEIRNDTKWLRRAITNAMIVSAVGGVIGLLFSVFKGGV